MEFLFYMFAVMLSLILFWILFTFAWIWRDARRLRRKIERDNEKMRRATAESMVTYMASKKSSSRRHQLPKEMTKVHERWAEKRERGVPPSHGNKGRIIKKKSFAKPPWRDWIREDPVREARSVPEAASDSSPHPRARPEFTPDMVTRRPSEPELHEVVVDIMGEQAHFSGAPRRAELPPIAEGEEILIPEPVTRAIVRKDSVTDASLPDPSQNRWGARSGSTEPSTGQLPPVPKKKRSSSRFRPPSTGSAGSAGSASQVVVDPSTGAATWHAKP